MKIDWFYVWLFLRPDVMFTYFKRWWQFGERPIKETMLVSDRPLTKEEWEYGASLEEEALRILQAGLQPPAKQIESTTKVISPAKVTGKRQPRQ